MAIYVTGDTHGHLGISKLNIENFPEQRNLTKKDYVIICGDFGLLWNSSKEELYWRDWLEKRNFTTLFVDGNHENFDMLNELEEIDWNGGKVGYVSESILHLKRGQIFNIDGMSFFVMGGASSIDKFRRCAGIDWWAEEEPNARELELGLNNLSQINNKVDVILTHTIPSRYMPELKFYSDYSSINYYFDHIDDTVDYNRWYSGHMHLDMNLISNNKLYLMYNKIKQVTKEDFSIGR